MTEVLLCVLAKYSPLAAVQGVVFSKSKQFQFVPGKVKNSLAFNYEKVADSAVSCFMQWFKLE